MRETRLSGLEGGGAAMFALPTPIRLRLGVKRCAPAPIRYALLSVLRSTFLVRRPQTQFERR